MTRDERRFKLVVGLSASERADAVLEYALDQAARHDLSAVHMLTVVADDSFESGEEARSRLSELARAKLEVLRAGGGEASRRVHLHVRDGNPGEQLVELAHEVEADLLVVGASAIGVSKPRIADVPRHVVMHAPCVVMLVRVADYGEHPLRDKQCPVCVAVRAQSQGERWFCESHSGRRSMTSSLFLSHTEPSLRGGPML
jgi:nucleotide-binding universal stress UspA family protein